MLSKLSGLFTVLIYVLLISLMINGCLHSTIKHKDDPYWLQESPLVIYRGAEYFWHDDFAGVDWKERNQRDMKMISYLFLRYNKDSGHYQLLKEVEEFSNDVTKYPPKKLTYLKSGAKEYILYMSQLSTDVKNYCTNYFKGDTSAFMYSELANTHFQNLKNNYYYEEESGIYELNKDLHDKLYTPDGVQLSKTEIDHYESIIKDSYESMLFYYKSAYKDIFKEEYN